MATGTLNGCFGQMRQYARLQLLQWFKKVNKGGRLMFDGRVAMGVSEIEQQQQQRNVNKV